MSAAGRALITLACCLLLLPAAAVGQGSSSALQDWVSPLQRDHPLAGVIWSAEKGQAITPDKLLRALAESDVVLLGEVHDNPDHHRLRAWVIGELASRRQASGETGPAVVLEHIRADQQHVLDRALTSRRAMRARDLLEALEWERSGWPSAAMFVPLFEELLSRALPILGGNTAASTIREVARGGLEALPAEERSRLGLDAQLDPPLNAALTAEIERNHCGLLPESAFSPMSLAQRYRDAHLADVVLSAKEAHGAAVLLAGNGHVRADRGVPWHLRRRSPETRSVTVAFAEVESGGKDAAAYVPLDPSGAPAVDYVWLTPQAERPDPCERMRQRYEKR